MRRLPITGVIASLAAALGLMAGVARGDVVISELLADNESGLRDEDGDRQDWLELYNSGETAVSLAGWWLTDKASNTTQWQFPAVSIPANGHLFIWASGKDRTDPASPLHASFSLSKSGEYLGLYRPDPTNGLPVLVDAYAPGFPALPPDISYGRTSGLVAMTYVAAGDACRYRVLTAAQGNAFYWGTDYAAGHLGHGQPGGWNVSPSFDDAAWTLAATGIGYDTANVMTSWIGTSPSGNCQSALRYVNTSLCFRRTFQFPDPAKVAALTLRMKYEDGFVAFVNGTEVGRANCTNAIAYNTAANTALNEATVNSWAEYAVPTNLLVTGTNLLAVQGLNVTLSSSDFLLLPELHATESVSLSDPLYYSSPTPGEANGAGTSGPLLFGETPADPDVPRPLGTAASPPLAVTVRVKATRNPVSEVHAYTRTMWNAESAAVTLLDDGVAPDAAAGDGVYSASLPTSDVPAGQMFRWRFEARDTAGTVTKLPAYLDPLDSPQYFGTVALNGATATSRLPVLEWFVQGAPATGPSTAEQRACCYYLTNFYDNIRITGHGQTSLGFAKHSYNVDFTGEDRFLWRDGERRVKDLNLLSNYADKTKTRNTLSHWVGQQAGTPYHFAFSVRVQLNGNFHGVMDVVEEGDDRMLERNGLNPDGALYKIFNTDTATAAEKKTRQEESFDDLLALTNGLQVSKALNVRQTYAYDNLDCAAAVNYIAARYINSDHDHGHKNFYLYRDTGVTGEWQPIIWDVDLSWGHVFNATGTNNVYGKTLGYFDDVLISTVGFSGSGNAVYKMIYDAPELRQMLMRRIRTLMDELLQPPGTANGICEEKMRAIAAAVDPDPADPSPWTDGDLDAAKWGIHAYFAPNRPREEVERVIAGYLGPRRAYLFNTGSGRVNLNGTVIPSAQVNAPGMVVFDALDFLPSSGTQAEEYVIFRNATAQPVDMSGWTVDGEISHTFKGGTVIPAGAGTAATNYIGLLHLVKDACAFRARASGPTGGERRFVQGNYEGQLSARGGTLILRDQKGLLIATYTYAGAPTLAQQRLRLTELQYHPAAPTAAESAALVGVTADDFEYVELLNLSMQPLPMTSAWFSQGIGFTFPAMSFGPAQRVIIAKNPAAFALRYPSVASPVLGPYEGLLDNAGERLELKDACGETIFDFKYNDGWYPCTDGAGRSLVVRDATLAQDALSEVVTWGISIGVQGTPGTSDAKTAQAYYGWDNFHFSAEERDDLQISGPYADPDGDGRVNWAEYALGGDPWVSDVEPVGFAWVTASNKKYAALSFKRPANAIDVQYELLATGDLMWELWQTVGSAVSSTTALDGNRESVCFRETVPATARQRFLKLRVTYGD
ncbi:MAG TPA: lamin tail domain-containing protein [Kiritimatiellia bacterium]|nr:lamin tail domain-containing protein [Kiritimatiellia bacterium]HPS08807.1 lamin tail domain-containing protein [Kiritimatiellia bacterium]